MKTPTYSGWLPFAWHGIQLTVPNEWNPGKIAGEHNNGSVRLDDAQTVRLELEWKDARGDDRVSQIVDRYIEGLAKNAEKQKSRLQVQRTAECPDLSLPRMQNVEYFVWEAQTTVHTLACYSPESDRLLFVRIMARDEEDISAVLSRVLNSLQDTPKEAAQPWALYDMVCTSPPDYLLENFELKSGHVRLKFQQSSNNVLQIDRLSLAQMILKSRTLEDWFLDFFGKDLRHTRIHCDPISETEGNLCLNVTGSPKSRWRGLLQPLPFWGMRPRLHLRGRAWTDFDANKIFTVQLFCKKPDDAPDFDTLCQNVSAAIPEK